MNHGKTLWLHVILRTTRIELGIGGLRSGRGRWPAGAGRESGRESEAEAGTETRAAERLTLFSDAVVAIAITLLAVDLPVPEGDTVSAFWSSVRRNDGHYAAFLISFVVIAAAWSSHHDLFRYTRRIDPRLRTFNLAWLLTIVLNPFATRLLTASGNPTLDAHALRFGFYALPQVVESGAALAMLRHMVSRGQMPSAPRSVVAGTARHGYALMAGFALSIPLFSSRPARGCCGSSSL